jgi:preprotein translocase subunit SecA
MFDTRAVLVGKHIPVSDSTYQERVPHPESRLEGILRGLLTLLPQPHRRASKQFCEQVNAHETTVQAHSNPSLQHEFQTTCQGMKSQGFTPSLVAYAFALVREASRRTLGMRHHDVQVQASWALLNGQVAEMATGEGKTLAATLAICTAAQAGLAVHVVTVNDYLAQRDAQQNQALFNFFGLGVGIIQQDMPMTDRSAQYRNPITYVSNKEITFDYLKDLIYTDKAPVSSNAIDRLLQRSTHTAHILPGLHFAIMDELDSILIDEAKTPLIISETIQDEHGPTLYQEALQWASTLQHGQHYLIDNKRLWLTQTGKALLEHQSLQHQGLWRTPLWRHELIQKALLALHVFEKDKDYIIADGKIQIVDEYTGRVMPDRSWERGLHQMIESKENCELTGHRRTLSQITYQRFFSRYLLLAGMTGTAWEVRRDLSETYKLNIQRIPTNRPSQRQRLPDIVCRTHAEKCQAILEEARHMVQAGRAVLIGTRSVESSEMISRHFHAHHLDHQVLNARQDQHEATIIEQAGQTGRITIATNMAGRGTDIKLHPDVKAKGGLHVILAEYNESQRIDRQLFGRAARQGDPGSVRAIVSLHDELFQTEAPLLARWHPLYLDQKHQGRFLFQCLLKHCQKRSARRSRHQRLQSIKQDKAWQESLGFVHPSRK